jgi:hypothetical protein
MASFEGSLLGEAHLARFCHSIPLRAAHLDINREDPITSHLQHTLRQPPLLPSFPEHLVKAASCMARRFKEQ